MIISMIEFHITALYNFFMNMLDAFEATPIKSAAELYEVGKRAFWEPIERIWLSFVTLLQSGFSFVDSMSMGVLPLIDSARTYLMGTWLFGARVFVEGSFQGTLFILTLAAPIIAMMKQFPLVSDTIDGLECVLKYVLQEYGEVDFEEGDIFELAKGPPISKSSKGKKRSGSGSKERMGKTALRPENDSIAVD